MIRTFRIGDYSVTPVLRNPRSPDSNLSEFQSQGITDTSVHIKRALKHLELGEFKQAARNFSLARGGMSSVGLNPIDFRFAVRAEHK